MIEAVQSEERLSVIIKKIYPLAEVKFNIFSENTRRVTDQEGHENSQGESLRASSVAEHHPAATGASLIFYAARRAWSNMRPAANAAIDRRADIGMRQNAPTALRGSGLKMSLSEYTGRRLRGLRNLKLRSGFEEGVTGQVKKFSAHIHGLDEMIGVGGWEFTPASGEFRVPDGMARLACPSAASVAFAAERWRRLNARRTAHPSDGTKKGPANRPGPAVFAEARISTWRRPGPERRTCSSGRRGRASRRS